MHTATSVLTAHGFSDHKIEDPNAEVKVLSKPQRQGDVLIRKITTTHAGKPLGKKGVVVVRAETNTANTHSLHGDALWEPNPRADRDDELGQGWLSVAEGAEAFLIHTEEHPPHGIGPGTYELRRQRNYEGEWRKVMD